MPNELEDDILGILRAAEAEPGVTYRGGLRVAADTLFAGKNMEIVAPKKSIEDIETLVRNHILSPEIIGSALAQVTFRTREFISQLFGEQASEGIWVAGIERDVIFPEISGPVLRFRPFYLRQFEGRYFLADGISGEDHKQENEVSTDGNWKTEKDPLIDTYLLPIINGKTKKKLSVPEGTLVNGVEQKLPGRVVYLPFFELEYKSKLYFTNTHSLESRDESSQRTQKWAHYAFIEVTGTISYDAISCSWITYSEPTFGEGWYSADMESEKSKTLEEIAAKIGSSHKGEIFRSGLKGALVGLAASAVPTAIIALPSFLMGNYYYSRGFAILGAIAAIGIGVGYIIKSREKCEELNQPKVRKNTFYIPPPLPQEKHYKLEF